MSAQSVRSLEEQPAEIFLISRLLAMPITGTVAWTIIDQRFVVIPSIIAGIYLITIYILATRERPQVRSRITI